MEQVNVDAIRERGPKPGQSMTSYTAELYAAVAVVKKLEEVGSAAGAAVMPAVAGEMQIAPDITKLDLAEKA